MSLITQRPKYWAEIIGQERAIRVLHSLLKNQRFLLRGFLFEGVRGIGKTSAAYILTKALMCKGPDPIGCSSINQCSSCLLIDTKEIDQHPDFREVDAASNSGVDQARAVLEAGLALPILGKRRVTMIDEAHRLSREAWDVYLKPLEAADTDTIFIFVTNNSDRIPDTIISRCCRIRFTKVAVDAVLGLLSALCSENGITYELEALKMIALAFKGQVRDPVLMLDVLASMGNITVDLVKNNIDTSLEDGCFQLFRLILEKKKEEAVVLIDELAKNHAPVKIIESMFSMYGKAVFAEDPALNNIVIHLGEISQITAFFMKWTATISLSSDVLPLFLYEMFCIYDPRLPGARNAPVIKQPYVPQKRKEPGPTILTPKELAALIGAKIE